MIDRTESPIASLLVPPRRNRRFFSFHRPRLCRGCGAPLGSGASEHHVPRTRDVHQVRNQPSRACARCLGIREAALDDDDERGTSRSHRADDCCLAVGQ